MNLKGGVIIIGSLIWEDHLNRNKNDFVRRDWRAQNLLTEIHTTPVPIRYGRKSSTRMDTYTMIFSKTNETSLGQGLLLEFNEPITSFEDLERQAIALSIAEGIYTNNNKRLSTNWGSVGLLINPLLRNKNMAAHEFIKKKWDSLYNDYRDTFFSKDYRGDYENISPIDDNGFLTINWQNAMNDFDLLIATPVIPNPKRNLQIKEISEKITETGYDKYFKNNIINHIQTFQDTQILEDLNAQSA